MQQKLPLPTISQYNQQYILRNIGHILAYVIPVMQEMYDDFLKAHKRFLKSKKIEVKMKDEDTIIRFIFKLCDFEWHSSDELDVFWESSKSIPTRDKHTLRTGVLDKLNNIIKIKEKKNYACSNKGFGNIKFIMIINHEHIIQVCQGKIFNTNEVLFYKNKFEKVREEFENLKKQKEPARIAPMLNELSGPFFSGNVVVSRGRISRINKIMYISKETNDEKVVRKGGDQELTSTIERMIKTFNNFPEEQRDTRRNIILPAEEIISTPQIGNSEYSNNRVLIEIDSSESENQEAVDRQIKERNSRRQAVQRDSFKVGANHSIFTGPYTGVSPSRGSSLRSQKQHAGEKRKYSAMKVSNS